MGEVAAAADLLPPQRLEAAFRAIAATRMQGLAFVNDRLEVEAVGFRRWEGRWLGVLITPWFMNLVLLPDRPEQWRSIAVRESHSYAFPAGVFDFIAGFEDGVGEFQSCSVFSPMFDFGEQVVARATAHAALAALFNAGARPGAEGPVDLPPPAAGLTCEAPAAQKPAVSKRDFLRGRWSGGTG